MRPLIFLVLLLMSGLATASSGLFTRSLDNRFLAAEQAFDLSVLPLENGTTQLHWKIAPGYYLYKHRLHLTGLAPGAMPELPDGEAHRDEYFGDTEIYRHSLTLTLGAGAGQHVKVSWQGCADAGLCYPPQSRDLVLDGAAPDESPPATAQAPDQALSGQLQERALTWSLVMFFGFGLLLAFTPCSLPMLPILAGIVVGKGASARRGVLLAGTYVLSMAMVYAGLGVLAALLGANLQAALQQPWLLGSFAALFVLLALPMFGVFELQLPAFIRHRLDSASRRQRGGSLFGAATLGVLSGLLIGPCMTAPLAAALLFIAQSGNALHGALVLFALGLGMGVPLLLLVTVGNRFLPTPGAWMDRLKNLFGFMFLIAALLMVRVLLADWLWLGLWGVLLLMLGATLLHMAGQLPTRQPLYRGAAWLVGLWGGLLLVGAAGGASDPWQPLAVYTSRAPVATVDIDPARKLDSVQALEAALAQARDARQWVLVDYYADWCVSCKVMDKQVFARPEVQSSLAGVRILKPDVTRNDEASRALLQRFDVPGPPTLLWIGPDGQERREARIIGEVDAKTFVDHWITLRERG